MFTPTARVCPRRCATPTARNGGEKKKMRVCVLSPAARGASATLFRISSLRVLLRTWRRTERREGKSREGKRREGKRRKGAVERPSYGKREGETQNTDPGDKLPAGVALLPGSRCSSARLTLEICLCARQDNASCWKISLHRRLLGSRGFYARPRRRMAVFS